MNPLIKPLAAALLAAGAAAAQAQNVLMLTTQDTASATTLAAIRNAYAAAGATVDFRQGALSNATPMSTSDFNGRDLVVIVTVLDSIHTAQLPALQNAMRNRASDNTAFVFYVDGCCNAAPLNTQNISRLAPLFNQLTGWSLAPSARQITAGGNTLPLNAASPYAAFYTPHAALTPSILGHDYSVMTGVPAANVLYGNDPARATPGAYTFFAPRSQSNSGAGACVLFTGDTTHMSPASSNNAQRSQLARASLALAASGHCQRAQPAAGQLQAVPTLGHWSLMLMALAAAGLGARRLPRKA